MSNKYFIIASVFETEIGTQYLYLSESKNGVSQWKSIKERAIRFNDAYSAEVYIMTNYYSHKNIKVEVLYI